MKIKSIIIASLFFSLSAISYGQENKSGLRGALNLSTLYVNNVADENIKPGFAVGAFFRSYLSETFSLQTELNYSLKGTQINYEGFLGGSGKYRYNLSYLELPVLANIHVGEALYFSAGPYIATLIAVKVKDIDGDGSVNGVEEYDRDNFNTFDYGVSAGIGFDFAGGTAGLRYNYGLAAVEKEGNNALTNGKNAVLQFFLGFDF